MAIFKLRSIASLWIAGLACVPVAIAAPPTTRPAQANDLTEIFADPDVPLTLQLGTLDANWKRFSLGQDTPLSPAMLFGMSGILESALRTNVYYTQGNTVTIAKQKYLIVYRPESRNINLADLMRSGRNNPPDDLVQPLTPQSKLTLSLINLSKIDSLKDIQPFDLQKEIEDSKKAIPPKRERPEARRRTRLPRPARLTPLPPVNVRPSQRRVKPLKPLPAPPRPPQIPSSQ